MKSRVHAIIFFLVGALLFLRSERGFAQYKSPETLLCHLQQPDGEVGTLEIEAESVSGRPESGNRFFGYPTEFE